MDGECILDEAKRLVSGDRREQYGHPYDDFVKVAKLWSVIVGVELQFWQVALMMEDLKKVRILKDFQHKDSWVDTAGYVKCGWEAIQEHNRRNGIPETQGAT